MYITCIRVLWILEEFWVHHEHMIGEVEPLEETLWHTGNEDNMVHTCTCTQIVSNIVFSQKNGSYPFYLCHRCGHKKRYVTPYIHILAKHVPSQMRSVNDFQDNVSIHVCTPHVLCLMYLNLALEKNNDDARRNYRSSNNIDGAKDIWYPTDRCPTGTLDWLWTWCPEIHQEQNNILGDGHLR